MVILASARRNCVRRSMSGWTGIKWVNIAFTSNWRKLINAHSLFHFRLFSIRMKSRERKSMNWFVSTIIWNWRNCCWSVCHLERPVCGRRCVPVTTQWTIWLSYNRRKDWPNMSWSVSQVPKIEHVASFSASTVDTIAKGMPSGRMHASVED